MVHGSSPCGTTRKIKPLQKCRAFFVVVTYPNIMINQVNCHITASYVPVKNLKKPELASLKTNTPLSKKYHFSLGAGLREMIYYLEVLGLKIDYIKKPLLN
ncbi:hypothetical protein N9936_02015 [bacterium]|nr:hypothetical protein [bacterium]